MFKLIVTPLVLIGLFWSAVLSADQYPARTVLLHFPWIEDSPGGNPVGQLNPNLFYISHALAWGSQAAPRVYDSYLRATNNKYPQFDLPQVDRRDEHKHSKGHLHNYTSEAPSGKTSVDKDDAGNFSQGAHPAHKHGGQTDYQSARLHNVDPATERQQQTDPEHFEVNAYYVPSDQPIPKGTVVFYSWFIDDRRAAELNSAGWIIANRDPIPISKDAPDPVWDHAYLKISACVPETNRQGRRYHDHFESPHGHAVATIDAPLQTSSAKGDPGHDLNATNEKHTDHIDKYVQLSDGLMFPHPPGLNNGDPLSMQVYPLVAARDDASWIHGMIIPFRPQDSNYQDRPRHFHPWPVQAISDSYLYFPEYSDIDPAVWPTPENDLLMPPVWGQERHKHEFEHRHSISIGREYTKHNFQGPDKDDDDNNETFAEADHSHDATVTRRLWSSARENHLKHSLMRFIRYQDPNAIVP